MRHKYEARCHILKEIPHIRKASHPNPRDLPGSPHRPRVGRGGHVQSLPVLQGLAGALVVLAVGLVQVGAQVLAGRCGGGRGGDRGRAAGQTLRSG